MMARAREPDKLFIFTERCQLGKKRVWENKGKKWLVDASWVSKLVCTETVIGTNDGPHVRRDDRHLLLFIN
jgi:hypothetical protein